MKPEPICRQVNGYAYRPCLVCGKPKLGQPGERIHKECRRESLEAFRLSGGEAVMAVASGEDDG